MIYILLLLWLLLVWWLWIVACAAESSLRDARARVPPDKRGSVSIFPGIPIFPLLFWGLAILIDRFAAPYGSIVIAALHLLFGAALGVSIIRNRMLLKSIPS